VLLWRVVVRGSACRATIWTSRRSTPGIQHGRGEGVPEHMGMWPGDPHARVLGEVGAGGGWLRAGPSGRRGY
jgi:hypothetical protein